MTRRTRLIAVALLIGTAAAVGGLVSPSRASALLSSAAVIAAVLLGYAAYQASVTQASLMHSSIRLQHRPLVVPMHETPGVQIAAANAVAPDGRPDPSWPSEEPFRVPEPAVLAYVFRVNAHVRAPDRPYAVLPLRNVGQGPAIVNEVWISSADGRCGASSGACAIGREATETLLLGLHERPPVNLAELATEWGVDDDCASAWATLPQSRLFFLEVGYSDTLGGDVHQLRAWFDPRDWGAWHVVAHVLPSHLSA